MHRRIAAFEAKRAGQIQDSTKANSEERHSSILFCLRPILLPTEYWRCTGQQRVPRLLDRLYRRVLSAAEGGITGGPSTWAGLQSWDGGAQVGEAPLTCAPPSPSLEVAHLAGKVSELRVHLVARMRRRGCRRDLITIRSNCLHQLINLVTPVPGELQNVRNSGPFL